MSSQGTDKSAPREAQGRLQARSARQEKQRRAHPQTEAAGLTLFSFLLSPKRASHLVLVKPTPLATCHVYSNSEAYFFFFKAGLLPMNVSKCTPSSRAVRKACRPGPGSPSPARAAPPTWKASNSSETHTACSKPRSHPLESGMTKADADKRLGANST